MGAQISNNIEQNDSTAYAEKTLFDVLVDIWAARFYMLSCMCMTCTCAVIYLCVAQPYYRAELLISPAQTVEVDTLNKAPQEGSLSIQPYTLLRDQNFTHFENILTGYQVSKVLSNEDKVMQLLELDRAFKFGQKSDVQLNANILSQYLSKRVKLEVVHATDLRRLFFYHPDPELAKFLLQRVYEVADMIIKAQRLGELNARIHYLTETLGRTQNKDHRQALTMLLLEQERKRMLAMQNMSFSARIIEPVSVSLQPKWPDKYLFLSLSILIGLFFGFVIHGVRNARRKL